MRSRSWCALLVAAAGCRAPSSDGAAERAQLIAELEQLRADKAAQQAERAEARLTQSVQAAVDAAVGRALGRELSALRTELGTLQEAATRDARALDARLSALAADVAKAQTAVSAVGGTREQEQAHTASVLEQMRREWSERTAAYERALVDLGVKLDGVRAAQQDASRAGGAASRPVRDPLLDELRTGQDGVRTALLEQGRRQDALVAALQELRTQASRPAPEVRDLSERLQAFGQGLDRLAEAVRALHAGPTRERGAGAGETLAEGLGAPATAGPVGPGASPSASPGATSSTTTPPAASTPPSSTPPSSTPPSSTPPSSTPPAAASGPAAAPASRPAESRERRLTLPQGPAVPSDEASRRVARADAEGLVLPRAQSAPARGTPPDQTAGPVLLNRRPEAGEPPPGLRSLMDAWATLRDPMVALPALVVIVSCIVALVRRRPAVAAARPVATAASAAAPAGSAPAASAPSANAAAAPLAPAASAPPARARSGASAVMAAPRSSEASAPPPPRLVLVRLENVPEGTTRKEQLERALAVARGDERVLAEPEPRAEVRSDGSAALRCYVAGFLPVEDEAEVRRLLLDALLARAT